jgi:hypothetical protein
MDMDDYRVTVALFHPLDPRPDHNLWVRLDDYLTVKIFFNTTAYANATPGKFQTSWLRERQSQQTLPHFNCFSSANFIYATAFTYNDFQEDSPSSIRLKRDRERGASIVPSPQGRRDSGQCDRENPQ